jgi:magnesium chelatase accessory protein
MDMRRLDWQDEGIIWPNRDSSDFVVVGGLKWHIQRMGEGPLVLLVHGTGASTHSWGVVLPLLARRFAVVAVDLPGHGFSAAPENASGMSLPGMANAIASLLRHLQLRPKLVIAHSAGAAVTARMCLDRLIDPKLFVGINAALLPLGGLPGLLFPPAARMMASTSLFARLFAAGAADRKTVERMIGNTGSRLAPQGIDCYAQLTRNSAHVAATLKMMANWDLGPLLRNLPALRTPMLLIVGSNDRTIAPDEANRVRVLLPAAEVVVLDGLGHLAHEEAPQDVVAIIEKRWHCLVFPSAVNDHDPSP